MAQYLDLTGLTYFKNKLLSSALHFYTGGGTTSNVTFDFGRMKSGSSTEREIYFSIQDADGAVSNRTFTINENYIALNANNFGSQASSLILRNTGVGISAPNISLQENVSYAQIGIVNNSINMTTENSASYISLRESYNGTDGAPNGDITIMVQDLGASNSPTLHMNGTNGLTIDSGNKPTIIKTNTNNVFSMTNGGDTTLTNTDGAINITTNGNNSRANINLTASYDAGVNISGNDGVSISSGNMLTLEAAYSTISIDGGSGSITLSASGPNDPPLLISSNNLNLTKTAASFNLGTGTNHNFTVIANNFQVASNGDISKIRQLKGGTNNYIWFNGDDIVFHNGQGNEGNEINLSTIIANIYTCLRGDTSYITMADRSRKLIQDIKPGDVVLSYDVNKKDYCEAVVLANDMTGIESRFDTFVFENGTTVDVYGDEPFIFEASDVLTIGTIQKLYDYHTKGDDRRWVLTHTPGAKARVIRKFSNVVCEEPVGRYMLVTSNGAFFVNGLLKGNMSNFIDSYYKKRRNKLPDSIQTFLTEISHKLAAFDNGLEDDHVDATVLKQLEIKWSAVHSAKDFLTATDYKAMKYAEGAMTEEEWLPVKAQRAEMRAVINENEAEITELRKQLPENLKQPTWVGKAQIWAECEGILNDHLQDFKDFIYTRYPKTEE